MSRIKKYALAYIFAALCVFAYSPAHAITCGAAGFTDIGGGVCRGYITASGTFTIPTDWSWTNTIEGIGESGTSQVGGFGDPGSGGGAYAAILNFHGRPGQIENVVIGTGGSSTKTLFRDSSTLVADFGLNQITGGQASNSVGGIKFSGGNGCSGGSFGGGGGGGAAGPDGPGANGGCSNSGGTANFTGGGGGGPDNGTAGASVGSTDTHAGNGGNDKNGAGAGLGALVAGGTTGGAGTSGGAGGGNNNSPGGKGGIFPSWDSTHGPGAGGGGGGCCGTGGLGGAGGGYGGAPGGGGWQVTSTVAGTTGLLVITYTAGTVPAPPSTSGLLLGVP